MLLTPANPDTSDPNLKKDTKRIRRVFQEVWERYHVLKPDGKSLLAPSRSIALERPASRGQRSLDRAAYLRAKAEATNALGVAGPGPSTTSLNHERPDDANGSVEPFSAKPLGPDTKRIGLDANSQPMSRRFKQRLLATHPLDAPPAYDWCTLAQTSVKRPQELTMPFMPYGWSQELADENEKNYLHQSWTDEYRHPADMCIMLETVKRLHAQGLRNWTIDRSRVLSRSCEEILAFEACLPKFPTPHQKQWIWPPPEIIDDKVKSRDSKDSDGYFCVCDGGAFFCELHYVHGVDHPFIPRPIPDTDDLNLAMPRKSCSSSCALLLSEETDGFKEDLPMSNMRFTNDEADLLRHILAFSRHLTYCESAELFQSRSCEEIALQIRDWRIKHAMERKPTPDHETPTPDDPYKDEEPINFTNPQTLPCEHQGPCVRDSCICASVDNHSCEANCHCDMDCPRRWRGCKCGVELGQCAIASCECLQVGRECDPEKCACCPDHKLPSADRWHKNVYGCGNLRLRSLKQMPIRTIVKPSTEKNGGYGLFAKAKILKDEVIHEYVGEIIGGPEADRRDLLYKHTRRNYVFDLDSTGSRHIDAYRLGNISRFINGRMGKEANVASRILNTNGDNRIIIFAIKKILPGEEIFLDYGKKFGVYGTSSARRGRPRKTESTSDKTVKRPRKKKKTEDTSAPKSRPRKSNTGRQVNRVRNMGQLDLQTSASSPSTPKVRNPRSGPSSTTDSGVGVKRSRPRSSSQNLVESSSRSGSPTPTASSNREISFDS